MVNTFRTFLTLLAVILWAGVYMAPAQGAFTGSVSFPEPAWSPLAILPGAAATAAADTARPSYSGITFAAHLWYQAYRMSLSKVRGSVCAFSPSCSRYSEEAINRYGMLKGIAMTADRLERCHCCLKPFDYVRGTVPDDTGRPVIFDPVIDHNFWHRSHDE